MSPLEKNSPPSPAKATAKQFDSDDQELPTPRECPSCGSRFSEGARFCPFDGEALQISGEAESDPLVGTVVDKRYQIDGVLGEGGMGTVYRVTHRTLDKEFALKVLRGDLSKEGDLAERFLREARSAAAIKHPSCCEITDFGNLPDGRPYFAMELLTGKPLNWWLSRGGPMPVAAGVRIVQQIAGVLEAAHQSGIVHRDLKPENVIVGDATTGKEVKVVDFGLAQVAGQSRLTRPGMVYGTPHYMSPEQAMGGHVDHRADIYALGVVMYEMFTGRVPFEADTYMGVLTKHMYMAPTPPSELIANAKELGALEDVILRCMQKRPERRYQRMVDLMAELNSMLQPTASGSIRVAPKRAQNPDTAPAIPLLADEIELPSSAEMRRSLKRFERGPLRLPWLVSGLVLFGGVIVAGWLSQEDPKAPAAEIAASARPTPTETPVLSVERPSEVKTRFADSDVSNPHGTANDSASSPDEGSGPPQPQPVVRSVPGEPEANTEALSPTPRAPDPDDESDSESEPPEADEESSKTKPDFVTGDIVDPWQN